MHNVGILLSKLQKSDSKKVNGKDRLRILHVDDDPSILKVLKSILELEGNFEVDTALTVDEACRKLEQQISGFSTYREYSCFVMVFLNSESYTIWNSYFQFTSSISLYNKLNL